MNKSNVNIIIIDDELDLEDDPLVFELNQIYNSVNILHTPDEGIEFVKNNLNQKNIVLLDYRFTADIHNGSFVLDEIRKVSKSIPVILWTANADKINEYVEIINNQVFAVMAKAPYEPLLEKIKEAEILLNSSIEGALEEWILIQKENQDQPYMITVNGEQYTLNDLLRLIRLEDPIGKEIEKDLIMLTIDLLLRQKEKLQ
jgi:DNA-binding NtrC family response regulator